MNAVFRVINCQNAVFVRSVLIEAHEPGDDKAEDCRDDSCGTRKIEVGHGIPAHEDRQCQEGTGSCRIGTDIEETDEDAGNGRRNDCGNQRLLQTDQTAVQCGFCDR